MTGIKRPLLHAFSMHIKVLAHYIILLTIEINNVVHNNTWHAFSCSVMDRVGLFKFIINKYIIIKNDGKQKNIKSPTTDACLFLAHYCQFRSVTYFITVLCILFSCSITESACINIKLISVQQKINMLHLY